MLPSIDWLKGTASRIYAGILMKASSPHPAGGLAHRLPAQGGGFPLSLAFHRPAGDRGIAAFHQHLDSHYGFAIAPLIWGVETS